MDNNALQIRAQVLRTVRAFFQEEGFLEVETPLLIPANAPEEHIDPVIVSPTGQLQTSPELCMKRLLCRGHHRIFQISRCWRAHERGSRHLSEFTMLEWYRANADYTQLMNDCEGLLRRVAADCAVGSLFRRDGRTIDPRLPWQRFTVQEAFRRFAAADALTAVENDSFDELVVSVIEPALAELPVPSILTDYPAEMAALARLKGDDPRYAERFELYAGGLELANGFSELSDPVEQRLRFGAANAVRVTRGMEPLPLPEPFLAELPALPPSAGIALGIDRLVMLTTGCATIDEVVAFTPEEL
ncbi:EF-P lysine aminoacylase EpmA [Trichlorobacter ammonificans]|uniref:Elongation factor P--(R)-beta-lysine ligase n=1 Tax=Trichlorobacter ammonificans TaxID=2916410 RepID=A0ABN8HFA0_9BACT|nr:EF-P lysine aminoacylase EpmA [Trichlorobacter ammonificans]CAH2031467.1 Elongation factor P--(R)-beta-lysine ligase [Trichlorobacter ammonificans]